MTLNEIFPNYLNEPFNVTSPKTPNYNCIAWAFGDDSKWYWPKSFNYWPANIRSEVDQQSFIELFELIGYSVCEEGTLEIGIEKIAIFTLNGIPTHAARQLENGNWTSKLGMENDVEHTLNCLCGGPIYGDATIFMSRQKI